MKALSIKKLAVSVVMFFSVMQYGKDEKDQISVLKSQLNRIQKQLDSLDKNNKKKILVDSESLFLDQDSQTTTDDTGGICQAPFIGLGDEGLYEDDVEAEYFKACYKNITARFGGKYTDEIFTSRNLLYLNNNVPNDTSFFIRTTFDMYLDTMYGKTKKPRITSHGTFRFRYRWGSGTEIKTESGRVTIAQTVISTSGVQANKHLLWVREAWMKIVLGNIDSPYDHFIQTGLIPYQAGRGISLGAAYKAGGFLGFSPGFSIDQFAPAVLVHVNPVPNKVYTEMYVSILENRNTSYELNNEKIRQNEIGACPQRGTGRIGYLTLLKAGWDVYKKDDNKLHLEPYALYLNAPDQKLEFLNDMDSYVTTFGLMVEGQQGKVDWGFEAGVNLGDACVKAWDRNMVVVVENSDAFVVDQYTKVYTQDPATTTNPTPALDTAANKKIIASCPQTTASNGQQIGTSGLWNAYNRFRPAQKFNFDGYFFLADASYLVKKDVLKISLGTGYASGQLDMQKDANKMTSNELMNQKFNGFIPIQSVYSGTRIRQLVVFNQGLPRFDLYNPNLSPSVQALSNITPPPSSTNIEFSNILFFGTKFDWKIEQLKKYKVRLEPNVIGYWVPETPIRANGKQAGNYLGLEWTTEASALILERLKLYSYFGVFFPGTYYKNMAGTKLNNEVMGSCMPYIINIGATYTF